MCIFCERAQAQIAGGLTSGQKFDVEQCEAQRDRRIKASILTGFLGSGKTTFLNYVLKSASHGKRIGVIQNEFGSVPIDDILTIPAESSEAEVVTMPNGCLCCRVRGDLVEALQRLAEKSFPGVPDGGGGAREAGLDQLLIECSGLSEVMPVAQTFFADAFVQASFKLDGIVCVCDASAFEAMEAAGAEEAAGGGEQEAPDAGDGSESSPAALVAKLLREQLAISDICLLNKCDLVSSAQRDRISTRVRAIRPSIKVVPCRRGKVNLSQVLDVNSFTLDSPMALDAHFLDVDYGGQRGGNQSTGRRDGSQSMGRRETNGRRRGLALAASYATGGEQHAHSTFSSLGLEMGEDVDLEKLKEWLRALVTEHGEKLVRIKGVLPRAAPDGEAPAKPLPRIIVQGVGGHIDIGEEAAPETAGNTPGRIVFIGMLDDDLRHSLQLGLLATAAGFEMGEEAEPAPEPEIA